MMRFEFAYHEVLVVVFIGGVILEISGLSEEANLPRGEADRAYWVFRVALSRLLELS